MDLQEIKEALHTMYGGENKPITDGNYDKTLSAKCVNGTFVGKKEENIISYKGIPFVGQQPVGDLRWKAPVTCVGRLPWMLCRTTGSMRPIITERALFSHQATLQPFILWVRTACI